MKNKIAMKVVTGLLLFFWGTMGNTLHAQTDSMCNNRITYFYWVGTASNDFFDEMNWRVARQIYNTDKTKGPICRPGKKDKVLICRGVHNPATDEVPRAGTIDPGKPIPWNLLVENASIEINNALTFSCIDKGLTLHNTKVKVNGAVRGTLNLESSSTVRMVRAVVDPVMRISFQDHNSWVYYENLNPNVITQLPLTRWMIAYKVPTSANQLLINQYYQKGSVVRMDPGNYNPLTVYSSTSFGGQAATVRTHTIHSGTTIPGGMNDNIRSFKLKRGFMATFAVNNNGTGKSKVYIASEEDLEISDLPAALSGNVSFIRVMPWNWSTKKGTGGLFTGNPLDAGWFYTWSATNNSQINNEYVPMTWGAGSTSPSAMQDIIGKSRVTHLLGFNESDNCSGESGQFNNLCRPDVAVAYYERLMGSGLRLGTPAPRENGPTTWLREFARIAKERDVRFDFVAVHWYDWGSNPATTPNANAQDVFNRFKNYLTQVYNEYQLPIWITEFNANPNRNNPVHAAFLQLALPYLESLPYVERYAYFQPMAQFATNGVNPNANYFDDAGNLTNIGQIYLGHTSSPSVPLPTFACPNNLEGMDQPLVVKQAQQFVFEAECGKNPGTKWRIVDNTSASNGKFIRGDNALAGATDLARQIHYDFEVTEENNFRIWVRTRSSNGRVILHVDHEQKDTISSVNSTDFTWHPIPRLYTFKPGKHRLTLMHWDVNNVITQFDQIAIVAGSDDATAPMLPEGSCTPESLSWGLAEPVAVFAEGEAAARGTAWTTGNDDKAIGGQFVQSGTATSPDVVPAATNWLTFTVDITTAGAYQFWSKVQSLAPTSNKLWLKINNGDFAAWSGLHQPGFLWKWVRFDPAISGGTRQEYLFLEAGTHTFTVAVASGGVKIDRIGLVPAGTTPEAIDPNVLGQSGPQTFEAEEATLLGTSTIVSCATSSKGRQVNMGTAGSNGVRFENFIVPAAGFYQLTIFAMNNGARSMRVNVNGTQLANQTLPSSGLWCFDGGSPAPYIMSIRLNAGENTITLQPINTQNAPFIDKIEIRPSLYSLEAEEAQFSGGTTASCVNASNNGLLNISGNAINAVQFNNISVSASGTYNLNVFYYSKDARTARVFINGGAATTVDFTPTGNWCFETPAGMPGRRVIPVTLTAGLNTIRFQPPASGSTNAPIFDKIDIVDPSNPVSAAVTQSAPAMESNVQPLMSKRVTEASGHVYPNPARAGSTLYLPMENAGSGRAANVTLFDTRGAAIKSSVLAASAGFKLPDVPAGIYMLRVEVSGSVKTYRILVQ